MGDITELPYANTMHETLGIRALEAGADRVVLEMDVGPHVHQPMGQLDGGASAVIAESAASIGAFLNCSPDEYAVGVDINITHLRPMHTGVLTATAEPVRKGRTVHVWSIDLADQNGTKIAIARCTLAVRPWKKDGAERG